MIRRACWLGGMGALASLVGFGISLVEAPDALVELVRRLAPSLALWLLFRPVLENRVWTRLILLLGLFHFAPVIVFLFWGIVRFDQSMETRLFYPLAESIFLLLMAFTLPAALGTPAAFRSAFRIGLAACLFIAIQAAFFALTDPIVNHGVFRFGIAFGLLTVRWSLVFAALAPDHIAMQRAALARKSLPNCEKCEYDLTGNVSGVCPECGTALTESLRERLLRPRGDARASEFTADQV